MGGKLRQIERREYSAQEFIDKTKQMISEITLSVMRDSSNRRIVAEQAETSDAATGGDEKPAKKKRPPKREKERVSNDVDKSYHSIHFCWADSPCGGCGFGMEVSETKKMGAPKGCCGCALSESCGKNKF